jgi:hypothetical protein
MRGKIALGLAAMLAAGAFAAVSAQGRGEALPGLPKDVQSFQSWTRINSNPIPPRDSDPHFGVKNVYVNKPKAKLAPAGKQRFPYLNGSIVVKSAKRPGQSFVSLVAIMRKVKGADPAHNDWRFVEYTRRRATARFSEVASGGVCWTCHAGAKKTDYVFTTFR